MQQIALIIPELLEVTVRMTPVGNLLGMKKFWQEFAESTDAEFQSRALVEFRFPPELLRIFNVMGSDWRRDVCLKVVSLCDEIYAEKS